MDALSDTKVWNRWASAKRSFAWAGVGIRVFILILIGALILVVAREWDWWVGSSALQSTDDAYLQADTTPLAAKVPGYVSRVLVQDFQRVHERRCLGRDRRRRLPRATRSGSGQCRRRRRPRSKISNSKSVCRKHWSNRPRPKSRSSEADVTRYHLETVRQQDFLIEQIRRHPPTRRTGRRQRKTRGLYSCPEPRQAGSAASTTQCLGEPEGAGHCGAGGAKGCPQSRRRSIWAIPA